MALQFTDNSTDEVAISSNATTDDLDRWTYILVLNVTATTASFARIFSKAGASSGHRNMFIHPSGLFLRVNQSGGQTNYSVADFLEGNGWTFMALTYDNAVTPRHTGWYGRLTDSKLTKIAWTENDGSGSVVSEAGDPLNLGEYPGSGSCCGMDMSDFAAWNRVLTETEIAEQFHVGPHPTYGSVTCLRLGSLGSADAVQYDHSMAFNDGVPTGLAVVDDPRRVQVWRRNIDSTFDDIRFPAAVAPAGNAMPMAMDHYRRRRAG